MSIFEKTGIVGGTGLGLSFYKLQSHSPHVRMRGTGRTYLYRIHASSLWFVWFSHLRQPELHPLANAVFRFLETIDPNIELWSQNLFQNNFSASGSEHYTPPPTQIIWAHSSPELAGWRLNQRHTLHNDNENTTPQGRSIWLQQRGLKMKKYSHTSLSSFDNQ